MARLTGTNMADPKFWAAARKQLLKTLVWPPLVQGTVLKTGLPERQIIVEYDDHLVVWNCDGEVKTIGRRNILTRF